MFADQSLLVPIPQVETVQQEIQDRLRKLPRPSGQKLQQVPATPDRMRQAKALEYMGWALPLHREEGDRIGEAIVLHNMGLICEQVDDRQKALDYLSASLALHRQASARQGEIHVLNAMTIVYRDLGETQRSVD